MFTFHKRITALVLCSIMVITPITCTADDVSTHITDAVPEEDPSIASMSEAEYLNGNIEHATDEIVNVFADAGKIESIPETVTPPTTPPTPDADKEKGASSVPRQDAGIRGCIVRIRTGYRFDDGSFAEWANGTGFLVGKDCILTTRSVAVISQKSTLYNDILSTQRKAYLDQGIDLLDFSAVKKNIITYAVADQGNVTCKIDEEAGDDSFVVLYPEQRINAYGTVEFAKEVPAIGEEVYPVGTEVTDLENPLLAEDFYIKTASMVETRKSGASDYIEFDGVFDGLPEGCPVVNRDQYVVGLITDGSAGRGSAVSVTSIKKVLDAANVEYLSEGDDSTIDIETLRGLLQQAEEIDRVVYTEESLGVLDKAVASAAQVAEEDSPSRNRIEKEAKTLQDALNGLIVIDHSAEQRKRIILIAVVALLVLAAALILPGQIKNIGKAKWEIDEEKEEKKQQKKEQRKSQKGFLKIDRKKSEPKKKEKKKQKKEAEKDVVRNTPEEPGEMPDDGESETTVLKAKSGNAFLVRENGGERIEIKGDFTIGKSVKSTWRITDNDTVSRVHCRIRHKGEEYYVEDLKALNGTFIDGEQLEPYVPKRIENGQELKLSDEVFVFHQ